MSETMTRKEVNAVNRAYGPWVYIFKMYESSPVFHGLSFSRRADADASRAFTHCGRLAQEYVFETKRMRRLAEAIPAKHATKFARPCESCFPEEDE